MIRWPAAAARVADAGAAAGDAGAPDDRPGLVDVIPGVSGNLAHPVLHARSPSDVWVAGNAGGAPRAFHFDGATWGAVALPAGVAEVRGLATTGHAGGYPQTPGDGTVWLATERALWRRAGNQGAWEEVPPPARAGDGAWEMLEVVAPDGRDLWIAARRTAADGPRNVVLRLRAAPAVVRWE